MLRQTMFPIAFREFGSSDYARLVEINNAIFPDYPWSVEEARFTDESSDRSNYVQKRFPCLDQESGTILGFGRIVQVWWNFHPQKFLVDILVDPKFQHRGLGSRIYQRLTEELEKLHATTAWATIKENMPRSLDFATKCGFVEKKRLWESRLVPSEADSASFQKYAERASRDGIRSRLSLRKRLRVLNPSKRPTSLPRTAGRTCRCRRRTRGLPMNSGWRRISRIQA